MPMDVMNKEFVFAGSLEELLLFLVRGASQKERHSSLMYNPLGLPLMYNPSCE
jgi:hypothetical protein